MYKILHREDLTPQIHLFEIEAPAVAKKAKAGQFVILMVDEKGEILQTHRPDKSHNLYSRLDEAKTYYWNIYQEKAKLPDGMTLHKYVIG